MAGPVDGHGEVARVEDALPGWEHWDGIETWVETVTG